MKIIQALKEFPLIEKKLQNNNKLLAQYAAGYKIGETVHIALKSVEEQNKEVNALMQSSNDLVNRRAYLRRMLAITNATVLVRIGKEQKSITEWIELRQNGITAMEKALTSLSTLNAQQQMRTAVSPTAPQSFAVIPFFDEQMKQANLKELMELSTIIDTTLETVNATTDLIEVKAAAPVVPEAAKSATDEIKDA